ncbi:MAG TPA: hypothetical protein VHP61_09820, partial [Acidobacteriota bacterium]|nr:hypothetical protein [Acidobacteriota bacterium]
MTTAQNMRKLGVLFSAFLALAAVSFGADLRIEVLARSANVRLKPALDSPVVGKATMGLVL